MTRSSLMLVLEQFPDLREQVVGLFERDDVFQELCEDYEACFLALARRESSDALRSEYAALRLRLETELLGRLGDAEKPPPGRRREGGPS
jgi:hypothetical protein